VELHLAYQDGHTCPVQIQAAHAPHVSQRHVGHSTSFLKSISSKGITLSSTILPPGNLVHVINMGASSVFYTILSRISIHFPVDSRPSLLNKGASPTSTYTTLWHKRFGHMGKNTSMLALRSQDITGAKYVNHVPLLFCEPCILAKLHHAAIIRQPSTKPTACFKAFSSNIFGPL
jgi:hypothetical protein